MSSAMLRNEWKYDCSAKQWLFIEQKLKKLLPLDIYAGDDGSYTVHSLYFDDLRNSLAHDSNAGASVRKKYRIRYYGNKPEVLNLECKKKINGGCRKFISVINKDQYDKLLSGRAGELIREVEDPLLKRLCISFNERVLKPCAIIDYKRTAYVEKSLNIRVTMDEMIRVSGETGRFLTGDYSSVPLSLSDSVLEVKFDHVLPGYLTRILSGENVDQISFSKYYQGRNQLNVQ